MKDYKIKNLGDVSKIIMGQAPHSKTYNTKKIGELLLRVNNFGNKYPTSDTYTTNPLKKSKDTDILLCVAGSCGKINFGINAAITRSIAAIRPGETLDKIFLYYFLLLKSKYFENLSTGAAQKIISKKLIEDTKIPIPKLSEQKRIVEKLDTCMEQIDKAIKNVEQNIQNVEDLFQSQLNEILLNNEKKTSLDELFNIKSSKRVLKKDWKTEGVPFYRGREVTELSKNGKVDNKLFILLYIFLLPPTIIDKSPLMAPISPPETGASIKKTFLVFSFLETSFVVSGDIVLISIIIVFFCRLCHNPFLLSTTFFTSLEFGKFKNITLHFSEISLILLRYLPPHETISFIIFCFLAKKYTLKPEFIRFLAMGFPIIPRPINPISL